MRAIRLPPRAGPILFDAAIAAGVLGMTGLIVVESRLPPAVALPGLVMAVAIVFRRRWPVPAFGAVAAAGLAQVVSFPAIMDPLPYDIAVLIAMYSVVKYSPRMRNAYLAAAVVGVGIVIQAVRRPSDEWVAVALWYLAVCGGVWLMAYTIRTRRGYVAWLEERAATLEREREHLARLAVADERAAIARELHDVVAHSLAVMIVQADGGRYAFESDPGQAVEVLETIAATGREALEDMRGLVGVLRGTEPPHARLSGAEPAGAGPSGADPSGTEPNDGDLVAAATDRLRVGIDHLGVLVDRARSAGLLVCLDHRGTPRPLPRAVEITVYRLAQEALTNVLRHAGPGASATVSLAYQSTVIEISIADDGGPGPVPAAGGRGGPGAGGPVAGGHGLIGMRERVAVHGGAFTAGPRSGGGWTVTASIPVRARVVEGVSG